MKREKVESIKKDIRKIMKKHNISLEDVINLSIIENFFCQ